MLTVFKYALHVDDTVDVPMPAGAKVLSVQAQNQVPCVWALVDTDARMTKRRFHIRGTGHPCEGIVFCPFVGTFQLGGGVFVGHVFDGGEANG